MAAMQAFLMGWALTWAGEPPKRKTPLTPAQLFARIDVNRDGQLSMEEFGAYFSRNPRLVSDKEWETLFIDIDTNENGGISLKEWTTWAERAKLRRAPLPHR